ncbi:hypothetical protein FOA24_31285 [Bacillus thuringiensis]|uniref:hypothetical protein n=1 Tax=Bacillus thuringiensis TaxID=1428 RepID=UPI003334E3D2
MTQFKFEFEKSYKEVDVAGTVYRVEFNDESLTRYQKELKNFDKESKELQDLIPDYETATDEEIDTVMNKQKELVKRAIETFFGKDTFDELYEKAGKSVSNLTGLMNYLTDIYVEESKGKAEQAQAKYVANIKK